MSETILSIKNLSVSYGDEQVINKLDLNVNQGEIICIVGESGSGKSTLLKTIVGIGDFSVTEGEVLYKNRNLLELSYKDYESILGSEIGYINQNPMGAFNPIRKFENQFREIFLSHNQEMDYGKMEDMFALLGLNNFKKILNSRPYEMSGGMNQRIAIYASMIMEPKILLCDEITSALDVSTASLVVEELLKLKSEMHTTIIMVTHSLGVAARLSDRIYIMHNGKIVEGDVTEEVLSNPKQEYTKQLLRDVPRLMVD